MSIVGRHRKIGGPQQLSEETLRAARLNMHVLGPGDLALGEWARLGLAVPDMDEVRRYRLRRVREQLQRFDCAGVLLFDPVNMRYATDSTNMQVWITHNAARYVLVTASGPVVVWDYPTSEHLSAHLDLIDERRVATSWMYMFAGGEYQVRVGTWAAEIAAILREHGERSNRLAVDRLGPAGYRALEAEALTLIDGEELMELARAIKSPEEVKAIRCAIASADASVAVMRDAMQPGLTEQELWAHLHAENIKRGGEWIETRLLTSGPRTNPWFQECSSRVIEDGDLVAFDTDLIGPYGYCVDYSRTWRCGDDPPTARQRQVFELALRQIRHNIDILGPGSSFEELTFRAEAPDADRYRHYSVMYHGVGMADEWPSIYFPEDWETSGYPGVVEPGMVIAVEAYVGPRDGAEGVKLEEMVLVTETGTELLTSSPLEL